MAKKTKAEKAEYMRQYRKKIRNLQREQELARNRYHQRHPRRVSTTSIPHSSSRPKCPDSSR